MNRTLTINISGIIFHIEEDAYEKLNRYLSTIRSYFAASEGRDEIMSDIEARIAELLKEKISTSKQVILMNDVDQVISIMGRPEDFAGEASEQASYETEAPQHSSSPKRRRVFRDPDDKILGGVCSGISAYFDTDPMWLRIIWALLAIFSFGTFVLIYILFWIILPEAKTTADKLEMRGEKININNIERSIREEFDGLKKKASDLRNDNTTGARFRNFLHELGNFVATIFKTVFKIVSKLVYLFLIFISIIVLIGLTIGMFSSNSIHIKTDNVEAHYGLKEILYSVFTNNTYVNLSMLALFLAVGIPFIMILYKAISRLAGVNKSIRALNMTALFLWIVGIGLGFFLVVTGAKNFQEGGKSSETVDIKQPSGDILYLNLAEKGEWKYNQTNREDAWFFYRFNDGDKDLGFAQVDIKPSPTDSFAIVINKIARGESKKEAMFLASELNYNFTQNDSVVNFSNFYELKEKTPWRAQKVRIEVLVPTNKKVHLNRNMKHLIYDVDNVQNTYDWDMVGRTWIMTEQGLDCVDCRGLEMNSAEAIRSRHPKNHVHDVKIEIHEDGPEAPPEPGDVNPPPSPEAPR